MDRNRILLVSQINPLKPFGSHIRPWMLAKTIARLGWKVTSLAPGPVPGLAFLRADYLGESYLVHPINVLVSYRDLVKHERQINIIYCHRPVAALLYSILRRVSSDKPVLVIDWHSAGSFESTGLTRVVHLLTDFILVGSCDALVVPSAELALHLQKLGAPQGRIHVIGNGVEADRIRPPSGSERDISRHKLGLTNGVVVLLVAPSHFPSNNAAADIAVRVAKALESYKELHFLFVGAKPGTAQNVTWLQFIPDIRDALWASDIAMAPFPVDARAGGARNKVLEYMSAGLPLVATAEGMRGIPNACPGVHYKQAEYSVDSIAADILELARDIKTRQKLGSSARALICTENSWKSKGEQLACLLRQVEQT